MQISDEQENLPGWLNFWGEALTSKERMEATGVAKKAYAAGYEAAISLPVQPVAWRWPVEGGFIYCENKDEVLVEDGSEQPLYANPVPPTKGPEDDLIAALEKRAKWHKCSCPEPCDDYGVFPGGCAGRYREDYLSLLALRSRPASALPVVKPLEWNDDCRVFKDGSGERCCDAETVGLTGFYIIWRERDGRHTVSHSHFSVGEGFATLDDAKASAQADYERRILSALTPSVQP